MRLFAFAALIAAVPGLANSQESDTQQDSALFGAIPIVEAAALHSQTLREAPADVTVISADEIRKYGYRTLNAALGSVRGFFTSSDRIYDYVGVRGFSLPGDYNTRFLVMLNGHPLTDQVYGSNGFFGQDLGIDMDLVARIEVIRGPSSALYGSNGMLANVNIVTKSPVDSERLRVSFENGSFGEKKAIVSTSVYLGGGLNLLLSGSVFNDAGSSLRFPGVGSTVEGVDGEKGYHAFANLVWHSWNFTVYVNQRSKQPPVPWGSDALLFQRGDLVQDSRNFVEAAWVHDLGRGKLRWQLYYDRYRYFDRFYYPLPASPEIEDLRSRALGDSIGTQVTWETALKRVGDFIAGINLDFQLQNRQQNYTVEPVLSYWAAISHPDTTGAIFLQQQWRIQKALSVYGGLRLDRSSNYGTSLSPRLALVYQPSSRSTGKLVYGRPFRNPSAFERYYTDGGLAFLENPGLRAEAAQTLEGTAEHKLNSNTSITAGFYDYRISHLIVANFLPGAVQQFANNSGAAHSSGIEFEINARAGHWLETNASYSMGRSTIDRDSHPAGVPSKIAKLRAATPLNHERLWLSFSLQYVSVREDMNDIRMRAVPLGDVTLSSSRLFSGFDLEAGVRNLAGWRYADPTGLALPQIPADGRSFFVKITYRLPQ